MRSNNLFQFTVYPINDFCSWRIFIVFLTHGVFLIWVKQDVHEQTPLEQTPYHFLKNSASWVNDLYSISYCSHL